MKVLKWLVITVLVLAGACVAAGFLLPDRAHLERSILIEAKPATVFTVLNGFRRFNQWSPWLERDPNARITVEGPPLGVGAKQSWAGNQEVGTGSQEIVASTPNSDITLKLVFGDFTSENTARFKLTPEGEGTRVVWSYDTAAGGNIVYRYFGLMLDQMLGADYEHGLQRLKTLVESLPKQDFSDIQVELVQVTAMPIAYVYGEAPADQVEPAMTAAYAKVIAFLDANGLKKVAMPMAITHEFDEETRFWKFDAAIPVDRVCTAPEGSEAKCGATYSGAALKVVHTGAYSAMEPTYAKLVAFKTVAGLEDNGKSWEHYVVDMATLPQDERVTHIYWPVK